MTTMLELTKSEIDEYKKCNQTIKNTRGSFIACGNALATVRDKKLYRQEYGTFEQYCEKEWGWKRAHAYRLIEAANYVFALPEMSPSGRQSVSKLNSQNDGAPQTERATRKAIKDKKSKTEPETIDLDGTGYPIPPEAKKYWDRTHEVEETLSMISKVRKVAKDLQDTKDLLFVEVDMNGVYADLNNAYNSFKLAVPYAVCTVCQGRVPKTCVFCHGRGVISKFRYDHAVPMELKEIRAKATAK